MYTVNETEGVVSVCIGVMDVLTRGRIALTLTTEPGTASGMFILGTSCSIIIYVCRRLIAWFAVQFGIIFMNNALRKVINYTIKVKPSAVRLPECIMSVYKIALLTIVATTC